MDWIEKEGTSETFSVADLVSQTASQFVFENVLPGFIYYDESGAYYNHNTGYFYYPESSLYFHPVTQLYYRYNEQTQNYEIYSNKVDNNDKWIKKNYKKRAINLFGEKFISDVESEDIIVAELIFDLVDRCSFFAGDYSNKRSKKRKVIFDEDIFDENIYKKHIHFDQNLSSDDDEIDDKWENNFLTNELTRQMNEEENARNAPCIRLLEIPSNILHIITILGASIGFGLNSDIQLLNSDQQFNEKILCSINYVEIENKGIYKLKLELPDIILKLNGEQIFLNNEYIISHGDQIQIYNSHSLLIHIHRGLNTCQGCEPGIVISSNQSSDKLNSTKRYSKNVEHHRQLISLKQQYGLLDQDNIQNKEKYFDRAKQRREELNSIIQPTNETNEADGIYASCKATPVPGCSTDSVILHSTVQIKKEISETNKGFKLLKGMGWSEGQGLGKKNQGMKGPIETIVKNDRSGLGMFTTKNTRNNVANSKLEILRKIRQRYEQIDEK